MSELRLPKVLQPDSTIEIGDKAQLAPFEDQLAEVIYPEISFEEMKIWQARIALKELIRPPKFNGHISDIQLEVMADPYAQLLSVRERGLKFGVDRGNPQARTRKPPEEVELLSEGFIFTANAHNSARGIIGQVQTELYYVPSLKASVATYADAIIQRHVAQPRLVQTDQNQATHQQQTDTFQVLHPHQYVTYEQNQWNPPARR
jgi:hypothetical protein